MKQPFGRGINLEIEHRDPRGLDLELQVRGIERYRPVAETIYEVDGSSITQIQVLIQDPDGYLLRFACEK